MRPTVLEFSYAMKYGTSSLFHNTHLGFKKIMFFFLIPCLPFHFQSTHSLVH